MTKSNDLANRWIKSVVFAFLIIFSSIGAEVFAQCSELAISCFVVGPTDQDIPASDGSFIFRDKDAVVSVNYLETGNQSSAGYLAPSILARHRDVGTTYGVAWRNPANPHLFVSAYMKRATGFGPLGAGGIYRIDPAAAPPANVTPWATIPNAISGADPHNFDQNGDHLTTSYDDAINSSHITKTSLGDLELDKSGTTLFVVNLNDKHLYSLPATGAAPVIASDLGLITGPASCQSSDFRPFGLGIHPISGDLFVGAVCSNESGNSVDGIQGYVLKYNGSFSTVFSFELDYNIRNTNNWSPWSTSSSTYQAILTDIEFVDDDLLLGLRGRRLDWSYAPNGAPTGHGDVLRACWNGATWNLESGGSCGGATGSGPPTGPGSGSFFDDIDWVNQPNELIGSLAVTSTPLASPERIVATMNDVNFVAQAGLRYYNDGDGSDLGNYEVYRGSPSGNGGINPTFGKTSGLGDIESNCEPAATLPVELGIFEGLVDNRQLTLKWETLSESSNSGFDIEHRPKGLEFESIAFVSGAGTSLEVQHYDFTIQDLDSGSHQFRLKQVNFDGSYAYSTVIEVEVDMPHNFVLNPAYPNPFNPTTNVTFAISETQAVTLGLYDISGHLIRTVYSGRPEGGIVTKVEIDGAGLSSGIYLLKLEGINFSGTQKLTLLQ